MAPMAGIRGPQRRLPPAPAAGVRRAKPVAAAHPLRPERRLRHARPAKSNLPSGAAYAALHSGRSRSFGLLAFLALFLASFSLPRAADDRIPVPPLTGRVVDMTGTLSQATLQDLNGKLSAFEERKGSQVAVLIVPTTRPEAIEQYSIRVAEQWKLGRKKVDDGAILLVAKEDRALRIEVGYGLEGALTDLSSKRIVSDIIAPHFREGDFDGGIEAGVDAMLKVIDGEPLPAPQPRARTGTPGHGIPSGFLLAGLFMAWAFSSALRSSLGRMRGGLVSGGVAGGIAFFILKSIALASGIGFVAFLVTAMMGGGGGARGLGGRRRGPWDGFGGLGGGGWGGGSGGGWGSGGGFSGGGGGFGGGGASGRW
jgi:uncharacterized protein